MSDAAHDPVNTASPPLASPLPAEFQRNQPYDDRGMLTAPIACCRCGYELRGLNIQSVCPECREPVARSAVGDLLEFMPLASIGELHRGLNRVTVGTFVSVLMPIFAGFGSLVLIGALASVGSGGFSTDPTLAMIVQIASVGLLAVGLVLLARAWWGLSAPPGGEGPRNTSAMRACLLMSVSYVAWLVHGFGGGSRGLFLIYQSGWRISAIEAVFLLAFPVWIGFSAAYMWHAQAFLHQIARRAPDPLLAHKLKNRKLSGVLWWSIGWIVFFLGPLAAVSNLLTSIRDCRFHTKMALERAQLDLVMPIQSDRLTSASESGATPDTLPDDDRGSDTDADRPTDGQTDHSG